jgi:hypothetical protein
MRKFSRTERILLAAALVFVGVWAALSFAGGKHRSPQPAVSSPAPAPAASGLSQRILAKEAAVRRLSSFNSRRAAIAAESVKYRAYLGQDGSSTELEWSELLQNIESLAKKSSVRLSGVKPGAAVPHEGWTEYRVEIETEKSPMAALLKFLGSLRTSPELLKIVQLKIVSSPGKEGSFRCSVTLSKAAFSS